MDIPSFFWRLTSKIEQLVIDDIEDLISLSQLVWLELEVSDNKLESTEILGEVLCATSLRYLDFFYCDSMRSFSKGLEHLTALERLSF